MAATYRRGTEADSFQVFQIFIASVKDLGDRLGVMTITGGEDPQILDSLWVTRESMFTHLANTADQFWIAEEGRRPVGYARSVRRGPILELTEFFVQPDSQSVGIGRELLSRAFPRGDEKYRAVVATLDDRALVRYLKAGVYPRFPLKTFSKIPELRPLDPGLDPVPMADSPATVEALDTLDRKVLGHTRPQDHRWLQSQRAGFLYYHQGELVGYGYVGQNNGPFVVVAPGQLPAMLAHGESMAVGRWSKFGVEVPLINTTAVDYLLANGFRMDAFTAVFMVNQPFGKFENYIFFSPPFFL